MALDKTALASIQEIDPDGSLGLIKDLVQKFTRSIQPELKELEKYHEANLTDQLALSAHRFKSSCQNVGANEMAKLLSQLEVEKNTLTTLQRDAILIEIKNLAKSAAFELQALVQ